MAKAKAKTKAKVSKKILITGGTGFLGSQIVKQFLATGEKNLRVMASSVPEWMVDSGVEACEGSVTSAEDTARAVRDVEAIFHLAGKVSRDNSDAAAMNRIHLEGTRLMRSRRRSRRRHGFARILERYDRCSRRRRGRRRDVSFTGRGPFALGVLWVEVLPGTHRVVEL